MSRSAGSRSRIWAAREEDGWAITTSSGFPALPVTQVPRSRGGELQPGHVHLLDVPLPKYALVCPSM